MSTYEKIIDIFQERLGIADATSIRPDATFEELEIDSLDLLEIITEIEMQFGVTIPDDEFGDFDSVGQAIQHLVDIVNQG
ncbi:MAG: acyl carrier protein [Bacillota bacterium]|nr:acyl carrier protein [Bacillota bacterium]